MESSFTRVGARKALLAISAGVLTSLALASPSFAGEPVGGVACQTVPGAIPASALDPADGRITGRGATFAKRAQDRLIAGYSSDVCGTTMVHYNDAVVQPGVPTGSGAGLAATAWSADYFGGTDIPYDTAQLNTLNNGPCGTGFTAPANTPFMTAGFTAPAPCSDLRQPAGAPLMSFPYVGGAVAVAVNLKAADCGGTAPGALRFTSAHMSRLLGGDIANWNDIRLRQNPVGNAGLVNCNIAIRRVVRQDGSGTTQIVKNYLARADSLRNGADVTCQDPDVAGGRRWGVQPGQPTQPLDLNLAANNRDWPGSDAPANNTVQAPDTAAGGGCTAVLRSQVGGDPPAGSGTGRLLTLLNATPGGIGYGDLADVVAAPFNTLIRPQLANQFGQFVSAQTGSNSNCTFGALSLPGGGDPTLSVGLDPGDSWAFNNTVNHSDPTLLGSGFPICGLTFATVWTTLSDTSGGTTPPPAINAISRMTPNERRTVYSYWTYALSSLGQQELNGINYAPIPAGWVDALRQGFQDNF